MDNYRLVNYISTPLSCIQAYTPMNHTVPTHSLQQKTSLMYVLLGYRIKKNIYNIICEIDIKILFHILTTATTY